jgi:hypothetical protein
LGNSKKYIRPQLVPVGIATIFQRIDHADNQLIWHVGYEMVYFLG